MSPWKKTDIRWLDCIDSTNSEARRLLPDLPSGTVLCAREQTAGRGQRGNVWYSEPGKNLTFSVVLKALDLPAAEAHWLNYATSCAVAAFLERCGVAASIKWPNDIFVGRRKICGMLIENVLDGPSFSAAVVGIGLNVNQREFPQLAGAGATSLALGTGRDWPLEECLEQLLALLREKLAMLSTAGEQLLAEYSARLFQRGVLASYRDLLTGEEYRGVLEGVAPDGRLRLREIQGPEHLYRFKEVGYIL